MADNNIEFGQTHRTRKSIVTNKKEYLIGTTLFEGEPSDLYLVEPSWDCDWYWGIGYYKIANNTNSLQSHFDILFFNDSYENAFDKFLRIMDTTVLKNESEVFTFMELMQSMYTARRYADMLHRGGSHFTTNPCKELIQNTEEYNRINKVIIPSLWAKIKELIE